MSECKNLQGEFKCYHCCIYGAYCKCICHGMGKENLEKLRLAREIANQFKIYDWMYSYPEDKKQAGTEK